MPLRQGDRSRKGAALEVRNLMTPTYQYRPEVLEGLLVHGIRPRSSSAPERVREFLNDLYRFEIRALRKRVLRKEFPKEEYYDRVVDVRRRYPLLSLPLSEWTLPGESS